jgi:hypothetical protein
MVEGELPAGLPEKTDVHVTLQADIDGTLKVTADVPSRPDVQIHAVLNWKGSPVSARPGPGDGEYQSSDWGSQDDMGSREIPSGWQNEAMMVRFMAAAVREEGRNIMPPNEYNIINQLGDQLEIALQNDDEQKGRRIMATLQPQIENLIFVNIGFAKLFKQDPELPRKIGMQKAEQLAKALNRLEQYRQSGQVEEYMRVYRTEFEALFAEILESITSTGSGGFSDLLGKRSGTWRTS